jgi:hypothetical protein
VTEDWKRDFDRSGNFEDELQCKTGLLAEARTGAGKDFLGRAFRA